MPTSARALELSRNGDHLFEAATFGYPPRLLHRKKMELSTDVSVQCTSPEDGRAGIAAGPGSDQLAGASSAARGSMRRERGITGTRTGPLAWTSPGFMIGMRSSTAVEGMAPQGCTLIRVARRRSGDSASFILGDLEGTGKSEPSKSRTSQQMNGRTSRMLR